MGGKPSVELSPGQRKGKPTTDPVPRYRLDPSIGSTDMPIAQATVAASAAKFNLRGPVAAPIASAPGATSPHIQSGLASDSCAGCHAAHDAQGPMLLQEPEPQSATCFSCHDGTGALSDVRSDWEDPSLPANDAATGSYYSHPATVTGGHVSGIEDEFAGVLNRHAVCADCHQPHLADATKAIQSTGGWSASGAIQAPGVAVTNGAAGAAPTYAWKQVATFEYELCLKCHSGYTTLPAQDAAHPSRWALDKSIELNPANGSYHPVEAAGTNQSSAMTASLAGTSPYKLWSFETDETVRCLNCHGDSNLAKPATPPTADARLDNHAGPNRGILIAPYRDRLLKSVADPYLAQDFGLCYVCHAEAPQLDDSGDVRTDTNFSWHGYHNTSISGDGTGGTDIDVQGAGRGNAICAECHFRTHGTALAIGTQAQAPRLVNFAPNVRPVNGVLSFTPAGTSTMGSCTLNCHGKNHVNYGYDGAP
jgi:predicted CXXCH cytochrome family protein